ncbi:MAG: tRNA guanosine(34) transglycosylase Tgt [Alphaproteobacteria bacterium]|nr:tRNA guanosine(34) transglycosylase Tgt [Alphaproteobacteria bacterium]
MSTQPDTDFLSRAEGISYPNFSFDISYKDPKSRARLGRLETPHGGLDTPNFIFCGTKASIKGLHPQQVKDAGADIILANTYHLMIQPGADIIEKMGGLHKFMNWSGPILTDSGGFQIYSMGEGVNADEIKCRNNKSNRKPSLNKITEEGATFRSYKDGSKLFLSPESAMEIQRKLGADFVVQLDECTAMHVSEQYTEDSMHMSHRWGDRSLKAFDEKHNGKQAVYSVVQGGIFQNLREESAAFSASRPFFGTALGGTFGGNFDQFFEIVSWCVPHIAPDRPVHLLGIGTFRDIFQCVRLGIDTFDCVSPTRVARHGWALMKGAPNERLNLLNAKYKTDQDPLWPELGIAASSQYSKAYIHHLFKAKESLGGQIVAQHNVAVMSLLMTEIRQAIKDETLDQLEKEWIPS